MARDERGLGEFRVTLTDVGFEFNVQVGFAEIAERFISIPVIFGRRMTAVHNEIKRMPAVIQKELRAGFIDGSPVGRFFGSVIPEATERRSARSKRARGTRRVSGSSATPPAVAAG